jgi:hypothetical protein
VRRSTAPPFVLERSQYASREEGWAAALDQFDQRMEVYAALARELQRQLAVKAGLAQPGLAPRDDTRRRFACGRFCASWVHAPLAPPRRRFLPLSRADPVRADAVAARQRGFELGLDATEQLVV